MTALVCNWWNVFARIAEPTEHKEALTSRPELLHLIATLGTHAGKKVLRFCSHHENSLSPGEVHEMTLGAPGVGMVFS